MITIWVPKRLVEIDLYNVAAQSPAALAEMSEKSYRQRVAYAAQKIRDSRAKIVMLTGPSASGKTTSAHKVAEALEASGTPAHVISLDNFFKGAEFYPRLPDGTLDYVVGTNLTYRLPELLTRDWYVDVDVSKYAAYFVVALNHDMSVSSIIDPIKKIEALLAKRG